MKVSFVIPSVNDPCLQKTVDDIHEKANEKHEIIVVFDGYGGSVKNARSVYNNAPIGLRGTVNKGVNLCKGDYIIKTDEHCLFDHSFDTKLLQMIQDDWIVVPRRYNLDIEKWEVMDDRPIDYERLAVDQEDKIGGVRWVTRAKNRKDIIIDETMVFQGSFYLMSKKHWKQLGGLQEKGYGPFAQEAIELSLKTWLGGGKVMVNKNTWYAHKHRKFKRVVSPPGVRSGNKYSKDFWLNNRWEKRKHDLEWLMQRFEL